MNPRGDSRDGGVKASSIIDLSAEAPADVFSSVLHKRKTSVDNAEGVGVINAVAGRSGADASWPSLQMAFAVYSGCSVIESAAQRQMPNNGKDVIGAGMPSFGVVRSLHTKRQTTARRICRI